jgi:phosphatidylglycerophosphate synthase
MGRSRAQLVTVIAWIAGAALFGATLTYVDFSALWTNSGRLSLAMPGVVAVSGAWHVLRTLAWSQSFRRGIRPPFARLFRVRLAAEAFSFVTIRGVAGEPLKVILLREVPSADAAAAVALERLSYMLVTAVILGTAALAAIAGLPLTRTWFNVFRAIAITASVLVAMAAIVVAGHGRYLAPVVMRIARAMGRSEPSIVGRFLLATERELLDLVRADTRRLAVLFAIQFACFVAMAMEVWIVLRVMRAPIPFGGAMTVETFTRAASMVSAFIPGNLGALEASNAAAVAAVGAAAAGGALALVRRMRGLLWAGIGFLVYPGKIPAVPTPGRSSAVEPSSERLSDTDLQLVLIAGDPHSDLSPFDRVAALPIAERVLRAAAAAGYGRVIVWAEQDVQRLGTLARRVVPNMRVDIASDAEEWRHLLTHGGARFFTLIGPATVVSTALLKSALDTGALTDEIRELPAGAAWPASGVFRCTPSQISDPDATRAFIRARRLSAGNTPTGIDISKGLAQLTIRPLTRAELPAAEATIRRATYKDTDPFLARFNRRISLPITMWLLRTPLTANALSVLLVGFGFYAAWLFSLGTYWTMLAAATLSLAASILDGCDGEIARLKYQESAFGCWLETVGDYSYYIAIFIGITIGTTKYTGMQAFHHMGEAALAGCLLTFLILIFLRQRITAGRPERLQAITKAHFYASGSKWAWLVAKISFCGTRSTMPYGIFAFALVGLLPVIVVLAVIGANAYWISLVVKLKSLLAESGQQPTIPAEAD